MQKLRVIWEQIRTLAARLSRRQQIAIGIAVIFVVAGLVGLQRWNAQRGFAPLYTEVTPEDAGKMTSLLDDEKAQYRLADKGATILVKEEQVAALRLKMAAAGLPTSGRIGFELFDQANFGASEFTEQVNYHRAIEGELERSVMSIAEVERARVHITMAKDSLYTSEREAAKASVLVKLRPGGLLSQQNISAITHLAASAVEGLVPARVAVVDTDGNLLTKLSQGDPAADEAVEAEQRATNQTAEYRKKVESELQAKIAQTLGPLLGTEHFRSGVSVEIDTSNGDESQEIFNPDQSVIAQSATSEDLPNGAFTGGTPGTASNLPRPTATTAQATGASLARFGRRTENVNYQTSRTIRHTNLRSGGVKRLSVSVLVDHNLRYEDGQPIIEPPAPEKLQAIREVIAAAVGLNSMRGDQVVVETLAFEQTLAAKPIPKPVVAQKGAPPAGTAQPFTLKMPQWLIDRVGEKWAPYVVGGAAALLLLLMGGGFWFWKKKRDKKKAKIKAEMEKKQLESASSAAEKEFEAKLAMSQEERERLEAEAILSLKIPEASTKKTDILSRAISTEAKKDPQALAMVVRSWINGEYQR